MNKEAQETIDGKIHLLIELVMADKYRWAGRIWGGNCPLCDKYGSYNKDYIRWDCGNCPFYKLIKRECTQTKWYLEIQNLIDSCKPSVVGNILGLQMILEDL